MSNKDWNGISETGIDKLMMDIIDYAEKMNQILNNISNLVEDTKEFYDCDSGEKFRNRYGELQQSFSTVNKNILSYNTDLLNVKLDYLNREVYLTENLNKSSSTVISRIGNGGEK